MKLGRIISKAKVIKCKEKDLPVLSITQRDGFVLQSSHFKKEIASKDKSNYNIVKRNQLVQSIHIDEGGFSVQSIIDEGIVSPAYRIWDVDLSQVNPVYLNTFLRSKPSIAYYKSKLRGTIHRRGKIDDSDILGMEIPVPALTEQERIVAELDLLQGIIDKQKAQLKELDTLAHSIFYDMFGDPIANEKGWEVKTLEGISTLITDGSHYSPQNDEHGDIPMLSVKDMRQTRFSYDTCKWIGREEYAKLLANGCKPLKNDVLIAKDGSFFKYIFVLLEEREQAILSSIAILRPKTSLVDPLFVSEYLSTEEVFSKVEREYLTGTAIKRVILKGIRRLPIILPPLPLQQAFATKIEAIERQKASINASIAETQKLFDYTMDKYFG